MIKYLFILINSLSLFIYTLFMSDGGITVSNNIPKSMAPGQEVPIELRVNKGNMNGFAKLQIELPAGLTVKEVDNLGANFSQSNSIAKWVWSSLPSDEELVVKCILVADLDITGIRTITGKYSYVENNAKMSIEMPAAEIIIGEEAPLASGKDDIKKSAPTETKTATAAKTETVTQKDEQSGETKSGAEGPAAIAAQRTITKGTTAGEYIVSLKIQKGSTRGFARYSDNLPSEYSAKAIKTDGASFSVADEKVKFVWVAVPGKDELELSYSISGINKTLLLRGEYSYLEQNRSKNHLLPSETITPDEPLATTSTPTREVIEEPKKNEPITKSEPKTETASKGNKMPDNKRSASETLPLKEGTINYMVQIGAFTNRTVNANVLTKKFKVTEDIKSEMQGGFSKFMVGDHPEYKNARDHREKMKNENLIASSFVVAYNGSRRITVQEALMISNQKWFK